MESDVFSLDKKTFKKIKYFFKNLLTNRKIFAIIVKSSDGRLAQLGEHLPYKQRVTGSSPVLSTMVISPHTEWLGSSVG